MRKNCLLFLVAVASAGLLASCAKEEPFGEAPLVPATIRLSIPEEGLTKVTLTQESGANAGVKLAWESTDVITVQNGADPTLSVQFVYKSGAGTATAEFTATDITPLTGASSYNICLTSNLPGGYGNQTQAANGSTAHLGYAATLSMVDTYDGATFSKAWAEGNGGSFTSSSVLRISAQLPTAAMADAVQKVVVKASAPLFDEEKELTVTLATPGVDGDGKIVTAYATLPAGDVQLAAGTELLFQFQVSDDVNDKYTAYRKLDAAKTLCAGQVNYFNVNCPNIQSFAGVADDGTQDKPFLIGDRHQMDKMRDELVKGARVYFKMVDDVDLVGISWEPVNEDADNQIDFNGENHIISHLTIDGSNTNNSHSGFFGLLHGFIHNVVFEEANVDGGNKYSGIVIGRSGASSNAADFRNVTVRNSTLTSSNNYVGGFAGYVKKSNSFAYCQVLNSTITSTAGNVDPSLVGGLVGDMAPNAGCILSDCSAENVTISGGCTNHARSGVGGLIGRINAGSVVVMRCHTTGTLAPSNANNVGGLIGFMKSGTGISVKDSYSTCTVSKGYTYAGGLVGKIADAVGCTIDHCFASGNISLKGGYGGHGGLVGTILGTGVTVKNSIAWNGQVSGGHDAADESSGAVVGYTHPNCVLTNNYRKQDMSFKSLVWAPSANFDHANVNGTDAPLKINTNADESNLTDGTASDFTTSNKKYYSYHGKHLPSGTTVTPDDTYGWTATPAISDIPESLDGDTENPSYTGNNVWGLGTTTTLVEGVTYTNFHGTWEGETREINIITTTLNEHNKLGIYYNYTDAGLMYLDEKCEHVGAIAGTNGSMTSQFIRVDDYVKRPGDDSGKEWLHNCALTIDGDNVDIVKVESNADAATLPNRTVSCAGPLLVWKGNKLTASAEWLDIDSEKWLTTGGNAGGQPRTAIGISKDGKKVIQVTVDGRWTSTTTSRRAIGMSTDLLAELMLQLGCYKAMNLDGGGGTQMWVYGRGDKHNIVNHPHNSWPVYGTESAEYYWIKDNEVARRAACCDVYIHSDLK